MLQSNSIDVQRESASILVRIGYGRDRKVFLQNNFLIEEIVSNLRKTTDFELYRLLLTFLSHINFYDVKLNIIDRPFYSQRLEKIRSKWYVRTSLL